jgi:hypothetical protein
MRAAIETVVSMGMALLVGPMVNDTRETFGAVKCTVMAFTYTRMVEPMKVNGWRVSNTDKAKEHGLTGASSKGSLLPIIRMATVDVATPEVNRARVDLLMASL